MPREIINKRLIVEIPNDISANATEAAIAWAISFKEALKQEQQLDRQEVDEMRQLLHQIREQRRLQ